MEQEHFGSIIYVWRGNDGILHCSETLEQLGHALDDNRPVAAYEFVDQGHVRHDWMYVRDKG